MTAPRTAVSENETMIYANQITRQTGERVLFSDLSFFLPAGSYTCVMGASGSGKTVLLEMIAGRQKPDSGSLVVNKIDMLEITAERLPYVRREIGFVESTPTLLENRSAVENIRLPLDIAGFDRRAATERVTETLDELGLTVIGDVPVQRLTNDQRWLVTCARATVHRPAVLLVDEPIDVSEATLQRQQHATERLLANGATVLSAMSAAGGRPPDISIEIKQGRSFINEQLSVVH